MKRTCGECQLCCTLVPVKEIAKPMPKKSTNPSSYITHKGFRSRITVRNVTPSEKKR